MVYACISLFEKTRHNSGGNMPSGNCPECGHIVALSAESCPNCGNTNFEIKTGKIVPLKCWSCDGAGYHINDYHRSTGIFRERCRYCNGSGRILGEETIDVRDTKK
jgi:DnaJ-class molecular chaperone